MEARHVTPKSTNCAVSPEVGNAWRCLKYVRFGGIGWPKCAILGVLDAIQTDHVLVAAKVSLWLNRRPKVSQPVRFDGKKDKGQFELELRYRLQLLSIDEQDSSETLWAKLKTTTLDAAKATLPV